jgi:threonine synthase
VQSESSAAITSTLNELVDADSSAVDWSTLAVQQVKASTIADSISVDRPRDGLAAVKAVIQSGGEAVSVADREILRAIPEMARSTGLFAEPAAAAPWAGLKKLVRLQRVDKDEVVVCIVSGSGLKDVKNTGASVGEPQLIEPSLQAVWDCQFP